MSIAGRALTGVILTLGLVATTSCSPSAQDTQSTEVRQESTPAPEHGEVLNPSRVVQSVHVDLSSAASVEAVSGTAISVAADGATSSESSDYEPEDVVGDLPVRLTTQFRTDDGAGTDLSELTGYTGRVQIELTVENLTVSPREIQYDVAGQSRTSTALVGAPLTIAASTELAGTAPAQVITGSGDRGTNGVLSRTASGDTVVQWATLLAPPSSAASTTLRLEADVEDFTPPSVDFSIQSGITTDTSAAAFVEGSLSDDPTSELELQKRTIDLIAEVNDTLTRAGSTITNVRDNLETTSETLGVKTAEELRDSSTSLATTMQGLDGRLESLQQDFEMSTTDAQSDLSSQLATTVAAVDSMLGDTSAPAPSIDVEGAACSAEISAPETAATVYGSLLAMSAQLDAYAQANSGCRDAVAEALDATIGPEEPTVEECAEQTSMTCSLMGSSAAVGVALLGLAVEGEELAEDLRPDVVDAAVAEHGTTTEALADLERSLRAITESDATSPEYAEALTTLDTSLDTADARVDEIEDKVEAAKESVDGLRSQLATVAETGAEAQDELTGGNPADRSMTEQTQDLADQLCALAGGDTARQGRLTDRQVEQLRSYLTSEPCETTTDEEEEAEDSGSLLDFFTRTTTTTPISEDDAAAPGTDAPTEAPAPSGPAEPTAAPQPTDAPAPSEPAEPTAAPQPTEEPAPSEPAEPTAAPEPTEEPTEEPSLPDVEIDGPRGYAAPLDERLAEQSAAWQRALDATDTEAVDGDIAAAFTAVEEQLDQARESIAAVRDAREDLESAATGQAAGTLRSVDELAETTDEAVERVAVLGDKLATLKTQQDELGTKVKESFAEASEETYRMVTELVDQQIREVSALGDASEQAVTNAFNRSIAGLQSTSDDVVADARDTVDGQHSQLAEQEAELAAAVDEQTRASLARIQETTTASRRDVEAAATLLNADLGSVLLDLGDRKVDGSGLLGAMATNAAKAETADYQLTLATQNAQGYANIRSQDVASLLLEQAQTRASLAAADELPPFHLDIPAGATSETLYTLTLGTAR